MTVSGGDVTFTLSHHTDADMQAILPLGQWTHIVLQGNGLESDNLSVYINGVKCPVVTNAAPGGCGWELSSGSSTQVYPQDLSYVKHMRLYSRLMTEAEIAANAVDPCLGISTAGDVTKMPAYWFKYNTPKSGVGSLGSGITETSITPIYPTHTLATSYAYQSLNGVRVKTSPDAGMLQNWYDYLGRVVVAQNAEQLAGGRQAYTTYDDQNRVIEVGEKSNGNAMDKTMVYLPAADLTAFASSGTNGQIMHAWYDMQYDGFSHTQENLHKQVSAKSYQDANTVQQMSYYSYDQLGNVKTLWQQIEGLETKQIEYNYDLVSGKVNKLRYQHLDENNSKTDQFYYGYEYDADNRMVKSLTGIKSVSSDGWEIENPKTDALYNYYLHGPLSRAELGNKQLVQGLDYAYTLQGWIKSVNSQHLNTEEDMGMDGLAGNVHSVVAPDVFGYSLDYYIGDYTSIGSQKFLPLTWRPSNVTAAGYDLYNGDVSRSTVAFAQFGNTVGYSYKYDQLNRMKAMRQHPLSVGATSWDASTAGTPYQEDVTYDGNGNILSYDRNGSGANGKNVAMDQLTYGYNRDASGYLVNNKLAQVTDDVITNDYGTADLKSQSNNNYSYDRIGNIVSDVQGGISSVTWTVYGKVRKITKTDGSTIEYKYDATGNRVYKAYTHGTQVDKTWYVRDVKGNVLAIYGNKDGDANVYWKEQQLYGTSRLGSWHSEMSITAGAIGAATLWGATNKKQYELSNYLGNVVATVSDELKPDNTALVLSANDYYPFGMIQPDRNYSISEYRYGFNGQERSDEINGKGNIYTSLFWEYDTRIGKRWNVDPLTHERPSESPYSIVSNNPLINTDPNGNSWLPYGKRGMIVSPNAKEDIIGYIWVDYVKDDKGNLIPRRGTVETAYVFGAKGMTTLTAEDHKPHITWQAYEDINTGSAQADANINSLDPRIRNQMKSVILMLRLRYGIDVRGGYQGGFRTYAEQDVIYANGNSRARGGYSNHNFALAMDVAIYDKDGVYLPLGTEWQYTTYSEVAKKRGLMWGGDWNSFFDPAHVEYKHNKSMAELRALPKDTNGFFITLP